MGVWQSLFISFQKIINLFSYLQLPTRERSRRSFWTSNCTSGSDYLLWLLRCKYIAIFILLSTIQYCPLFTSKADLLKSYKQLRNDRRVVIKSVAFSRCVIWAYVHIVAELRNACLVIRNQSFSSTSSHKRFRQQMLDE